jgi:hypothetical protein
MGYKLLLVVIYITALIHAPTAKYMLYNSSSGSKLTQRFSLKKVQYGGIRRAPLPHGPLLIPLQFFLSDDHVLIETMDLHSANLGDLEPGSAERQMIE